VLPRFLARTAHRRKYLHVCNVATDMLIMLPGGRFVFFQHERWPDGYAATVSIRRAECRPSDDELCGHGRALLFRTGVAPGHLGSLVPLLHSYIAHAKFISA
jgi:hypothetical protein